MQAAVRIVVDLRMCSRRQMNERFLSPKRCGKRQRRIRFEVGTDFLCSGVQG